MPSAIGGWPARLGEESGGVVVLKEKRLIGCLMVRSLARRVVRPRSNQRFMAEYFSMYCISFFFASRKLRPC